MPPVFVRYGGHVGIFVPPHLTQTDERYPGSVRGGDQGYSSPFGLSFLPGCLNFPPEGLTVDVMTPCTQVLHERPETETTTSYARFLDLQGDASL